jgi:F-type H+-transporting ATPase subunit alpha
VEILKQLQYEPMSVERQVISIYAVTNGYLDPFPVEDAKRFEEELLQYVESRHPEIGRHIVENGDLPDEQEAKLKQAVEDFSKSFQPSEGAAGTKAGSAGGPVDQQRKDTGWEAVGEPEQMEEELREAEERAPDTEELVEDVQEPAFEALDEEEREAGPSGDTGAQPPL